MKMMCFLVGLLLLTTLLSAHPATKVDAVYDKTKQVLTVTFDHPVKNATEHFISNVTVTVNKKGIVEQKIFKQDSLEKGSVVYKINGLVKGDTISVETECNKSGKKSQTITVE